MSIPDDEQEDPSVECPTCEGNGWRPKRLFAPFSGVFEETCDQCNGHGWVAPE